MEVLKSVSAPFTQGDDGHDEEGIESCNNGPEMSACCVTLNQEGEDACTTHTVDAL
jgi:hypothetical protein